MVMILSVIVVASFVFLSFLFLWVFVPEYSVIANESLVITFKTFFFLAFHLVFYDC